MKNQSFFSQAQNQESNDIGVLFADEWYDKM